MRPIFSPTEYIQSGRGTDGSFKSGNTEYEKEFFFLLDFCGVAEYFEEQYDYTVPLELPKEGKLLQGSSGKKASDEKGKYEGGQAETSGGDDSVRNSHLARCG
jgi:type I site-specific restriction endonuclease